MLASYPSATLTCLRKPKPKFPKTSNLIACKANMKGLLIRDPWIELILSGKKSWEMRSKRTHVRGEIALIRAGSGLVVGTAELADCLPALQEDELRDSSKFHQMPAHMLAEVIARAWTTPWVLRNVRQLPEPVRYEHPSGAVTWVGLGDLLNRALSVISMP